MSGDDPSIETSSGALINGSGFTYQITANGLTLPQPGQGNSEYDPNWAVLAPGKPIQLVLKSNASLDWTTGSYFTFRVPDLDRNGLWDQTLNGTGFVVNWTLSASGESLQANGSQITVNEINTTNVVLNNRDGLTLSGSSIKFGSFY